MELAAFDALLAPDGQRLLAAVTAEGVPDEAAALALGTRLRRDHPPELVAAALTQVRLRDRARAKFGADAEGMYFTPDGLEQATRSGVARLRARRFAGSGPIADLCCGIGGDLAELARGDCPVTGVDHDPLTVALARANVEALGLSQRVSVECTDVEGYDLSGFDRVFCDPARRSARGRIFDPASYSPAWPWVERLLAAGAAGVKVAPGIPHDLVAPGVEAEWVSERGEVKEAVLWSGALATGVPRRATVLPAPHLAGDHGISPSYPQSLTPNPALGDPPVGAVGRYLYEPDGAVIRAHLVAEVAAAVGGRLVEPTIAYIAADTLVPTPFATPYQVHEVLPFQLKRLRSLLRERGVGRVTIKKRGFAMTPEELRSRLRLSGSGEATIVLTRVGGQPIVLLVSPAR